MIGDRVLSYKIEAFVGTDKDKDKDNVDGLSGCTGILWCLLRLRSEKVLQGEITARKNQTGSVAAQLKTESKDHVTRHCLASKLPKTCFPFMHAL